MIFLLLLFAGCHDGKLNATLNLADSLLRNNPDSALTILQQFSPASGQAECARYALLYTEAQIRNRNRIPSDSLIRQAWNYYRHHPEEVRNQCKTLYLWGRIKLNAGDKPGALRLFLQVEDKLKNRGEPYYKGLLYERIGDVYYEQMNYVRAYHYFKEARENFQLSDNPCEETEATLDMAAASYRQKDMERAMRLYSAALDLADEQRNEILAGTALSSLASLYVKSGKKQIPQDLLQRIEQSARKDSRYGNHTMVDIQLLKHRTDSARHYLQLAEVQDNDVLDKAELYYTAYRIEALSGNFRQATDHIHRYIYLTDSLTRSIMQFSAGMIEKEYFQERSAFSEYRMKNRVFWEVTVICGIFLLTGIGFYIVRQRLHIQRERNDHYLLLAEEARAEYQALTQQMEGRHDTEKRLKSLVATRFGILDKLGKTYYERENTSSQQAAMFQEVKRIITDFSENNEIFLELEQMVDTCHDNAMQKLRQEFPAMKENDIRLLCYIFTGFSPQVISLFMKESVANVYARKSRLKSRIKAAGTPHTGLFMSLFG